MAAGVVVIVITVVRDMEKTLVDEEIVVDLVD